MPGMHWGWALPIHDCVVLDFVVAHLADVMDEDSRSEETGR